MKTIYYIFIFIAIILVFVMVPALCSRKIGPTEAEIERMVNERVAAKLAEQGVKSSDTNMSSTSNATASNNTAKYSDTKTQYVYEFIDKCEGIFEFDDMPYRLTINTEEETAQITVGVRDECGRLTSEKKTFYGTFGYWGGDKNKPYIKGITGADEDEYWIVMNKQKFFWSSYKIIDFENGYLYMGKDEFEAKNPDYRIKMTLVE